MSMSFSNGASSGRARLRGQSSGDSAEEKEKREGEKEHFPPPPPPWEEEKEEPSDDRSRERGGGETQLQSNGKAREGNNISVAQGKKKGESGRILRVRVWCLQEWIGDFCRPFWRSWPFWRLGRRRRRSESKVGTRNWSSNISVVSKKCLIGPLILQECRNTFLFVIHLLWIASSKSNLSFRNHFSP